MGKLAKFTVKVRGLTKAQTLLVVRIKMEQNPQFGHIAFALIRWRCGLTSVLEHIPFGGGEQLENIVTIMERMPLLRFHLDSGHAKLERSSDRREEYLEAGRDPKKAF